jgi:hypothetical protein
MHGRNQWPDSELFPGFDKLIIDYMDALTGFLVLSSTPSS